MHRILDGADHEQACPECGQLASDPVDEPTTEIVVDTREAVEQDFATLKPSSTKELVKEQGPGLDGGSDSEHGDLA